MGTHSSPVDSAGGYRFYQFTALPCNMATVPLQFTKVAKVVKLMARAEGISIRQYIDGWLMRTNLKNRIVGLQFDLRVGLVFPTQRKSIVFWQGQLPCWKLLVYLQGSSCHFESMASMENTIPLGYLNMKALQWYLETLLISSVSGCPISWVFWFRDHLQWWTSSSILKEYSPLLQEHSFLSIHRSFPNGLGCFLSRPQPLVCGIRKSQDSTLHNIGSNVVIFKK